MHLLLFLSPDWLTFWHVIISLIYIHSVPCFNLSTSRYPDTFVRVLPVCSDKSATCCLQACCKLSWPTAAILSLASLMQACNILLPTNCCNLVVNKLQQVCSWQIATRLMNHALFSRYLQACCMLLWQTAAILSLASCNNFSSTNCYNFAVNRSAVDKLQQLCCLLASVDCPAFTHGKKHRVVVVAAVVVVIVVVVVVVVVFCCYYCYCAWWYLLKRLI